MRNFVLLILALLPLTGLAQPWEDQRVFNPSGTEGPVRILSSTDTTIFAPVLDQFLSRNPTVVIEYLVTGTADIDRRFRADPRAFDVVISSAMDLQLKLANDGLARQLRNVSHPDWAQWRQSLFAFTSEPATIVINRQAFAGHPIPKSRQDLIQALRARPETFQGRVGTYDVRQSGLGYLFATQDARASETYWRLMEVMGSLDMRLYCCSGDMIDDLADGTIAVAYNVLGSYAEARVEDKDTIEIILPSDFPTTMMRTALVSANAPQLDLATSFVRHLITHRPQAGEDDFMLPALTPHDNGHDRAVIPLEPALLTFLDALKRRKFLAEWEDAVIQP